MRESCLENGRRLAFRDEGSGPALILLHGWSMSAAVFSEVMPALTSGYRVLVPDLPGHGNSDSGPSGYPFAGVARDLSEWLLDLGIEKCNLLGWSMGGQIAMELGRLDRPLTEKQILVSATPRFANGDGWEFGQAPGKIRAMKRNLERDCKGTKEQFFRSQFEGEGLPSGRMEQMASFVLGGEGCPDAETLGSALTSLAREDQRALLGDLRMPSLVVHGKGDRIVPPQAGWYLAEHLPRCRLKLFDRVGHAPFLSRPPEMIDLWLDFLS